MLVADIDEPLTAVALWIGHRVIGAVQLTLRVVLIVHALGFWP
ncbi:hypothetical protein ACFZC6_25820 [Streptomyces ossamyceticus]|uniref:MAPEG family protein n=1 Tax=Streptomyces ossamyceticus TaxID=249581 RepID=A0ABV2V5K4_9ACTN